MPIVPGRVHSGAIVKDQTQLKDHVSQATIMGTPLALTALCDRLPLSPALFRWRLRSRSRRRWRSRRCKINPASPPTPRRVQRWVTPLVTHVISAHIARLATAENRALALHLAIDVVRLVCRGATNLALGRWIVWHLVLILLRHLPWPVIIVICRVPIEPRPFGAQAARSDDLLGAWLWPIVGVLELVDGLAFELLP